VFSEETVKKTDSFATVIVNLLKNNLDEMLLYVDFICVKNPDNLHMYWMAMTSQNEHFYLMVQKLSFARLDFNRIS
jgi:hypothetical protein